MADDWDLNAIVRSCSSAAASSSAAEPNANSNDHRENNNNPLAGLTFDDEPDPFAFPDLAAQPGDNSYTHSFPDLLQDSYKPFLPPAAGQRSVLIPPPNSNSNFGSPSQPRTIVSSVSPRVVNHKTHHHPPRQPQDLGSRHRNQRLQSSAIITLGPPPSSVVVHPSLRTAATMQSQPARSRKKKNNQKRLVVQVTADNLSNDVWAWRKYGQKPIKGSPYPRNYYRCSSSKGCAARKQVERSTTDPNMFIISYAGDHTHPKPTHRNSLAGSTRTKFPAAKAGAEVKESAPPPTTKEKEATSVAAVSLSPTTPLSPTMDHDRNTAVAGMMTMTTRIAADIDDVDGLPEFESGDDDVNVDDFDNICGDDDDDDDDSILIPNNNNVVVGAVNEDLFVKGWPELGGGGGGSAGGGAAFGDNFSSWIYGSASTGGG